MNSGEILVKQVFSKSGTREPLNFMSHKDSSKTILVSIVFLKFPYGLPNTSKTSSICHQIFLTRKVFWLSADQCNNTHICYHP